MKLKDIHKDEVKSIYEKHSTELTIDQFNRALVLFSWIEFDYNLDQFLWIIPKVSFQDDQHICVEDIGEYLVLTYEEREERAKIKYKATVKEIKNTLMETFGMLEANCFDEEKYVTKCIAAFGRLDSFQPIDSKEHYVFSYPCNNKLYYIYQIA
jgi:hypothetical protein